MLRLSPEDLQYVTAAGIFDGIIISPNIPPPRPWVDPSILFHADPPEPWVQPWIAGMTTGVSR